MKRNFHKILFILTILVFVILLAQTLWHPIKFKKLEGVTDKVELPDLNFKDFCNGSYQSKLNTYLSNNYGFREFTIRLYNQYIWSAYKKENVDHIVAGKEGWLFYKHHVDDYYGQEMYKWQKDSKTAIERYEREIRLMKKLRGVLKEYDIEFLVFVAPDKAFIYPEYLPEQEYDTTTIYARDYYVKRLTEEGFPNIDMTEMFIRMSDTTDYILMPSKGAHWNNTCVYGVDTLLRLMENLTGDNLAKFSYGEAVPSYRYLNVETDIEEYLNILFEDPIDKKFETKERLFTIKSDSTTFKPNVLFVGNSYLFQVYDYIPINQIFSDINHWYYNHTSYSGFKRKKNDISEIDRLKTILNSDYVVWYTDGCQMYKTSYGFVEDALIRLCVEDDKINKVRNIVIDSIYKEKISMMRNSDSVIDSVAIRKEINKSVGSIIKSDPERYYDELSGPEIPTIRTKRTEKLIIEKQIVADSNWMKTLNVYAQKSYMSIDEVVELEVDNILNNNELIKDKGFSEEDVSYALEISKVISEIKNNEKLLKQIEQKALKNNKTLEQAIIDDAKWIIKNRKK